jgi:hypothetical protein
MAESENYRKGAAKRRQLMGDAAVEAASKGVYSDPVMQKFLDVAIENVFGALWTRPGLTTKRARCFASSPTPARAASRSSLCICAWRYARAGPRTS